ncbi:MAG: YraN family protein [Pseudomonadota bacterium]
MTESRKKLGERGEEIAIGFLKKNKYKILNKNYRCPFGEIDIIAQQGKTLSFIEVKTRSSELFGAPQEAVHLQKQKKISRAALAFIQRYQLEDRAARFDVITVKLLPGGVTVDLIQNAFELTL